YVALKMSSTTLRGSERSRNYPSCCSTFTIQKLRHLQLVSTWVPRTRLWLTYATVVPWRSSIVTVRSCCPASFIMEGTARCSSATTPKHTSSENHREPLLASSASLAAV